MHLSRHRQTSVDVRRERRFLHIVVYKLIKTMTHKTKTTRKTRLCNCKLKFGMSQKRIIHEFW